MTSGSYEFRAVDLTVYGEVNSDSFLNEAKLTAQKYLLSGWIKNVRPSDPKSDNSVESHLEGLGYQVDDFLSWIRAGVDGVRIGKIVVTASTKEDWDDFKILN